MTNSHNETTEIRPDGTIPWLRKYPQNIDWYASFEARPLYDLLDATVERFPENNCTNFLGKTRSYNEIGEEITRLAAGLQSIGIEKGMKVGLFLPNCPTYIIFYFAILKVGGVVVNYNPLYAVEELEYQIKDSQTEILVTLDLKILFDKVDALLHSGSLSKAIICPFADHLPPLKSFAFKFLKRSDLSFPFQAGHGSKLISIDQLLQHNESFVPVAIDPKVDLAVLQYTGGTTGTPKGAMLSHANLYINIQQILQWAPDMKFGEEKVMGILPFFHVFAMTAVMNYGIAIGAELILMPKFQLDDAMKLINRLRPTIMPGVPTLYNTLMNHPDMESSDFSSLKFCISGGAALPLTIKHRFESLSGCTLIEGYGLSETSPVATANPLDGPVKEGSIGIPCPRTILSIRSLENPESELPPGESGEICISGPQVMSGYWNKPEQTKDAFVGEFFRTGDVGYMDDDGFIFIVDRIKDLIITSGFNVYPRRIEDVIYQHPAVEEVTVIGIPDEHRGEVPKAFVKLRAGQSANAKDILTFVEPKLSKIEWPTEIEFRDELPKTMVGKLSKKELREKS